MASLSSLVSSLAELIHMIKCNYGHDNKKCEMCGIKFKNCEGCLEYTNVKDDFIENKCLCCNKNYQNKFDTNLESDFLIYTNFLTMISKSLFCCCEKMFTYINAWMIGTNSMKHHYQRKKIFTVT